MLGGRPYVPVEQTTFEHDEAIASLMMTTGVQTAISNRGDVLAAVLSSKRTVDFLALLLVPLDTTWSPEVAEASAASFRAFTDPADKQQLWASVGNLLHGFLLGASPSATPSPNASAPTTAPVADVVSPRAAKRRVGPGSGRKSSPVSPTT